MRWTVWLILLVLMGIFEKSMEEASSEAVLSVMGISAVALVWDWFKKRKK